MDDEDEGVDDGGVLLTRLADCHYCVNLLYYHAGRFTRLIKAQHCSHLIFRLSNYVDTRTYGLVELHYRSSIKKIVITARTHHYQLMASYFLLQTFGR